MYVSMYLTTENTFGSDCILIIKKVFRYVKNHRVEQNNGPERAATAGDRCNEILEERNKKSFSGSLSFLQKIVSFSQRNLPQ